MLEKILDEKYFFIMEKFYFEKILMTFFLKKKMMKKISWRKYILKIFEKNHRFLSKNRDLKFQIYDFLKFRTRFFDKKR